MVETSSPPEQVSPPGFEQNCIFCHIIAGRVPAKEVYSDSKVKAVLDINPANPGHVLVLPKEHHMILPQLPEDLLGHMAMVAKSISKACLRGLKAQATNIFVANGAAAGQKAAHVMIHVIPRNSGDGLQAFALPHRQMPDEQYEKVATVLGERVRKVLGDTKPEQPSPAVHPEKGKPAAPAKQEMPVTPIPEAPSPVNLDNITALLSGGSAQEDAEDKEGALTEDQFIASKKGGKFHMPNCPFIAKINAENRVTITAAEIGERKPCECVHNAQ